MNEDPVAEQLRESNWRRGLTAAEQAGLRAWLAAHPEAQAAWEDETALSGLLARLPDAPMPSNFTARVLQAVESEQAAAGEHKGTHGWPWLWRVFAPRAAVAALVIGAGFVGYQRYELSVRVGSAKRISLAPDLQVLSRPEALENFEPIHGLSATPSPDVELLALLK